MRLGKKRLPLELEEKLNEMEKSIMAKEGRKAKKTMSLSVGISKAIRLVQGCPVPVEVFEEMAAYKTSDKIYLD